MYTATTMNIPTALVVSVSGLAVVFIMLLILMFAIAIISSVVGSIAGTKKQQPVKAAAAAPVVNDEADKELLAVLAATIAEDLGSQPDEFQITKVTEIR
ncbi:MAG: OadG family protein [Bacillota bacterium]|uniref:Sodium pump decarboxylases, gamma subunit n=1 Tax=[Clostridium] aminophilum TaxID=1526 RepID=A0A1I6J4A7_9FIRM|nr:OadG family protein [[Clostridium] aminophilum]MDT3845140.1 OadG family protein [Bacillota bacterium]SFR73769.1 sodium pump decarboxylases, gamma subunit [[Clostridium] aminophilum]